MTTATRAAPAGEWVPFASSVLRAGRWDGPDLMTLRFASGRAYTYQPCSFELWNELYFASSKGDFYNRRIKGRFA